MLIKDIMTMNVVTVPSHTSIADVKKIMGAHKIRRLPIVDRGKLMGIVTEKRLEQYTPSKATSLSVWEISYLLGTTPVKEIMEKNVVTVNPEMTVEESIDLSQKKKVGSLVVAQDGQLVGILTTNDVFYKIVNSVLGLGMPGKRVEVTGNKDRKIIIDVVSLANEKNIPVITLHVIDLPYTGGEKKDIVIHLDAEDVSDYMEELRSMGYEAVERTR